MGFIYKIQNLKNQKIYIGQTIQSVQERWYHHLEDASLGSDLYFHRALRKYGRDNFSWEIIEEIDNDKLNDREIYWINYYNSYNNGYNLTPGGDLPPRNDIPVICLETEQIFPSAAEAGRQLNINKCHIAECARGAALRITAGGYHWMRYDDYKEFGPVFKKTGNELASKQVENILTHTIYPSILAASKATGISRSTIRRHCDKNIKDSTKINWRYIND